MLFLSSDYIIKLLLSYFLAAVIGLDREIRGKPAGLRTHILVSLSATLLTILSMTFASSDPAFVSADPSRIAAAILTGIGFIGTGVIIASGGKVQGVTTAASIWTCAAIGMAVGLGEYGLAAAVTFLAFLTLWALKVLEGALDLSKR